MAKLDKNKIFIYRMFSLSLSDTVVIKRLYLPWPDKELPVKSNHAT